MPVKLSNPLHPESPTQNRPYWVDGQWCKPKYLSPDIGFYMKRILEIIQLNQGSLFDYWNNIYCSDPNDPDALLLEEINPEDMRIGMQVNENMHSLHIFGQVQHNELECGREDKITLMLLMILRETTPDREYRLATMYLNALQSLLEVMPAREILKGWPPNPTALPLLNRASILRLFVNVGEPTSEMTTNLVGASPVMTIEITVSPPILR